MKQSSILQKFFFYISYFYHISNQVNKVYSIHKIGYNVMWSGFRFIH